MGSHDGTLVGDATYAPGMVGQAFSLDGDGDYVSIPNSSDWDLQGDFTIDLWVRLNAPLKSSMFLKHEVGGFELWYTPQIGELRFNRNVGAVGISRPWSPQPDIWYFLAVVRTDNSNQLYVDGNPLGSSATASAPTVTSGEVRFGSSGGNPAHDVDGLIDEVEVFHRALSATEVQALFNAGAAGKCLSNAPAVTSWGLSSLALLIFLGGMLLFRRRQRD
jgi:hypothetical protein